jgi:hypothetical protein
MLCGLKAAERLYLSRTKDHRQIMDTISREAAWKGAVGYTKTGLAVYDSLILGFNTPLVWKCPNARLLELYNRHVSGNHLDVGVGSGYFLDRCSFPAAAPRLGLLDLNPLCLAYCARRLKRYRPETHEYNVLEPLPSGIAPFDSVSMTYLLHCMPGTIRTKAAAFENLRAIMTPGAVVFGATVLQGGVPLGWLARRMLASLNEKQIFSNTQDDLDGFRQVLAAQFTTSDVQAVGAVGVFWAKL